MWRRAERYPLKPPLALIDDPQSPPAGARLLNQIQNPQAPGEHYLFFANNGGLSILRSYAQPDGQHQYEQSDFPQRFVDWFAPALRDFRKPAVQDTSSRLSSPAQEVGGEMLTLERGMAVGGDGSQGYIVNNWSRKRYLPGLEGHFMPMNVAWTEDFLFNGGLIRLLSDIRF
ncbi:hypothetical protein C4K68_22630 [Pokkaliibacter plantistimulans]|uniref:Uncharacterized protein n=1 Tax=Proteobacteria bacterium 228 TaxID=2083153 RepID=A0A2S5KK70_9PROT|nr:hypothetical protein [Pokkaliibacter plantistimulans]PPC75025.1 hypothetical protein C4K68_22630 [Pokkaliibacter plantistimulans]